VAGGRAVSPAVFRAAIRAGVVLVALVGLAGCGLTTRQESAVRTFSAATIDFTRISSTELVKSRTDVLRMNALRQELDDGTLDGGAMDRFFTVERVKTRLDALAALERYATLLHALVTSSQAAELRAASTSFVTSLRKVDGMTLSDTRAAALAAGVERVGGLLVEYMRARAVREVVTAADPAVVRLIALVRRDFDPGEEHLSLGYDLVVQALGGAADLAARRDGTCDAALIGEARVVAQRNGARVTAVASRVTSAADALVAAEGRLREAVAAREADTAGIERFAEQVRDLTTIYTILRDD
jgi:hypothetical protein